MALVPYVIETTPRGERGMDIYSRLLRERIVFIGTPIDDQVANTVVAQLLMLRYDDPDRDISLYINSPGGVVQSGLAIYDAMQFIQSGTKARIHTLCYGLAASFAAVLLAAGGRGCRTALPNSNIMIHQPHMPSAPGGQATDIEINAREILRLRSRVDDILARHTGQPLERIQKDTDRDHFLSALQAKEYGLIDDVMTDASEVGVGSPAAAPPETPRAGARAA